MSVVQNGGAADVGELIRRQDGVITRSQALAAGMSLGQIRSRLTAGRWQRLLPGVFATFSGPVPRSSYLWAVVLAAGPGAVLSHETAAELDGIIDEPSPTIHVTVPAERVVRRIPGVRIHRSARAHIARHPVREPPRTRVAETVIDLTQTARSLQDAYGWIARAINARLTTVDHLRAAMAARKKLRQRRLLCEGLGDVAHGCRSVLEIAYLRGVERAHGLPAGVWQVPQSQGTSRVYLDVLYRRYRTRVELDGRAAHTDRFRDMRRDNAAVRMGDAPLRYGTADIMERPCEVAAEIAGVLRSRGWTGRLRRCRRPGCRGA